MTVRFRRVGTLIEIAELVFDTDVWLRWWDDRAARGQPKYVAVVKRGSVLTLPTQAANGHRVEGLVASFDSATNRSAVDATTRRRTLLRMRCGSTSRERGS